MTLFDSFNTDQCKVFQYITIQNRIHQKSKAEAVKKIINILSSSSDWVINVQIK